MEPGRGALRSGDLGRADFAWYGSSIFPGAEVDAFRGRRFLKLAACLRLETGRLLIQIKEGGLMPSLFDLVFHRCCG